MRPSELAITLGTCVGAAFFLAQAATTLGAARLFSDATPPSSTAARSDTGATTCPLAMFAPPPPPTVVAAPSSPTLRTINGYDIGTPDDALAAYAALRSANDLSIAIDRDGAPLTLSYRIE